MGKKIHFNRSSLLTLEEAVEKIHELSKNSENVFLLCDHAKERAKKRKASL
jgi:hypothetical protein